MNELTVEKIKSYVDEFIGLSSLGDRLMMELPPEHNDVIVHAPVEIYKYLLDQLTTIERETADKCAEITVDIYSEDQMGRYDMSNAIRNHFKLGE